MKKQRNYWWYGFTRSAIIILLVTIPFLMISGVPKHIYTYAALQLVPLGLGTIIFGLIERHNQRSSDKTKCDGN